MIDTLGVLTGLKPGITTVSVDGGAGTIEVYVINVDLDADTDRDNVVDNDKDEPLDAVWSLVRGATYSVNCDDDDNNGKSDAIEFTSTGAPIDENFTIENAADAAELAKFVIRSPGISLPRPSR